MRLLSLNSRMKKQEENGTEPKEFVPHTQEYQHIYYVNPKRIRDKNEPEILLE